MTLDEKIKALKADIKAQRDKLSADQISLRNLVEKSESDEDLAKAKDARGKVDELKEEIRKNEDTLKLYQEALEGSKHKKPVPGRNNVNSEKNERRKAIIEYIRSKGAKRDGLKFEKTDEGTFVVINKRDITPTTDGVSSTDVAKTIPDAISYNPQREIQTVVDLKPFTNVFQATTKKGSYPTVANATTKMATVAELAANPAMAKPDFDEIDWAVDTYRQALPISQESLDDSEIDLMDLLSTNADQIKLNTTNDAISSILKTFTDQTVASLDDLKLINNTKLDPAYARTLVVTQSFYQWLDTLKDNNGRYLLQDSIISPSGKVVFGIPVVVVSDVTLGVAGEAHAFLGDIKRAVLFANRADFMIRWVDDNIYGQYLQAGMRFGVAKADAKAGYFLTYTAPSGASSAGK
ncbi:phage major capsid protein [Liquorilactobacillus nagelii]|jgi:HK97 family phage major capsid protein|uniref:phage major capsid protein n=1 Tax=Liquorilactobacillus nagelii TaxID=82688 RepID=UPI00242FE9C4|nr:phage major capsid protein [Liquorilactobacillus nagelii]MCI1699466.1 phage major capsid protein [Liquorilactobacillus nagelii]